MNIDVVVDESIYPLECVMSTAYVFIDRCYVLLDKVPEGVKVSLSPKPGITSDDIQAIGGDFQNELLGQALRMRIAQRHEKVRETIVARALFGAAPRISEFASTGTAPSDEQVGVEAQYVPQADDDYLDDPLGIAVPWEEKYGKAQGDGASGAAPSDSSGSASASTTTSEDRGPNGGQKA